jgi:heat shock protein HtpX
MTSFFDEIAKNKLSSVLLLIIFGLFFAFIVYLLVVLLGGGLFGFIIGAIVIAAYACFSYFYGDKLVLKVSHAKEADPKEYKQLYNIIQGLALANQTPMPKVYIIQDPSPNAFATGRDRKHAAVAVTTGLLQMMDKRELEGVLAHEMSHILDNDILFMMIAIVFAGSIGLIAAFIRYSFLFGAVGRERGEAGLIILIVALVMSILAPIFALLVRLAISRRREYMADANGARIIRDPAALAGALKKIEAYTQNPKTPPLAHANELTASLYISNPFKSNSWKNIFSTHPPIEDRIKRLQAMY